MVWDGLPDFLDARRASLPTMVRFRLSLSNGVDITNKLVVSGGHEVFLVCLARILIAFHSEDAPTTGILEPEPGSSDTGEEIHKGEVGLGVWQFEKRVDLLGGDSLGRRFA